MLISYYYPKSGVGDNYSKLFCKYTNHKWLYNDCNKDVDLVYAGSINVLRDAAQIALKFKKPLICWVWDLPYNWRDWVKNDPIGYQLNEFRDEVNARNVELLELCDLVITGSKWTQSVLEEHGIKSEQIYSYFDNESIDKVPEQVKEDQIIQISRYFFNKRFELSVLATRNTPYKMVCVGFGKDYCKARVLGLPNNNMEIYCDLIRADTIRHLKRSKLLVSPSVFEGWGITPIEALHCNIPILLSDLEVFKEVYGDRAIYHERDNVDDMEDKINLIMSDETLQKKIVKDCKEVIHDFTPKKFAKRWDKLIK